MVADWYDGPVLETEWTPAKDDVPGRYRLILTNHSKATIENFRLGISGPARVSDNAEVRNARVITQVSNFAEFAPEGPLTLKPGESWIIDVFKLDYPIRHWTDAATTGFVIRADGSTVSAITIPVRHAERPDRIRKRGTLVMPVPDPAPVPVSIIPWPKTVAVTGRRTVPHGFTLTSHNDAGAAAIAGFTSLTERLFAGEGLVRPAHEGGLPVDLQAGSQTGEAYGIQFFPDRVKIEAGTHAGFLYGLITLGQIQRGARLNIRHLTFPTGGRIDDAPQMRWRGCHLYVARRYYAADEIEQFLACLAWNKMNRFHFHLSDDEGWRVEIDAYPQLTEKAAWRGYGMHVPPLLGSGPERTGGYYSKDDIRALVKAGDGWGIEIVPEIDVPGHCYAMLQAMPELRDPGENAQYRSIQAFPNNCLNPAIEAVYPATETIFAELCELFPSRYFHVGADEVPATAWQDSPAANALRQKLGVEGAAPLQAHYLQRIQTFLTGKGKITGAWEEAAQGGGIDKANCYMVGWHTVEASQKLAAEGYEVVVAPGQAYYMDMALGEDWHECGAAWAGWSSPEKCYNFTPDAGWSETEREKLLGVQGCIWSEPMTDRAVFDRLVFPRVSAIAETGWTAPASRNFARWYALAGLMPNLYGQREEA